MFPQTHVHFAQRVLGRMSDAIALGSIFPDMIINPQLGHKEAHSLGNVLMGLFKNKNELHDFARGVVTHGIEPGGLDFYGDEKYPGCERGYCFEKARPLIEKTARACNIPKHMGWWKAHNIVEMGIELHISNSGPYGEIIQKACSNSKLIRQLEKELPHNLYPDSSFLRRRITSFPYYIEVHRVTPERLARKYRIQMYTRHGVQIDTVEVAKLISSAAERISDDIEDFFDLVHRKIKAHLRLP